MRSWKKIAVLFGFSMSAAVFGAACTTEVTPLDETQDPTDEAAVVETAAEVTIDPLQFDRRGDRRGDRRDREGLRRCENNCRDRFERCMRPIRGRDFESGRYCRREREQCFDRCQRRF
jgi:hypothetical protein